jgi:hypothetical protein
MYQQKPSFVTPALIGGVALGISSALPLLNLVNCACCALVIGGGFLATFLYLREYPPSYPPVSYGDGAVLGLLTGAIGGLVWSAVDLPLSYLKYQIGWQMTDFAELESALSDPNIPPALREFLISMLADGGLTLGMFFFSLIFNVLISAVFAMIGALIGLAVFQRPAPPPAYQSPSAPMSPPPSNQPPPPAG